MKKEKHPHPVFTAVKLLMLLPLLLLIHTNCTAQSPTVTDAYITMQPTATDSTLLQGTYIVALSDSINVANIELKIGSSPGAYDILNYTFVFDTQAVLPAGFSYARLGNTLTLQVGAYSDRSTYFCAVRVQAANGTWSAPNQFISN